MQAKYFQCLVGLQQNAAKRGNHSSYGLQKAREEHLGLLLKLILPTFLVGSPQRFKITILSLNQIANGILEDLGTTI